MAEHHLERIDVLKLDCEGSEFSIFESTTSLDRIGAIVGEFHGRERFLDLVARKFSHWQFRILHDGEPGTFWLINPCPVGNGLRTVPPAEDGLPSPSRTNNDGLGRPSSSEGEREGRSEGETEGTREGGTGRHTSASLRDNPKSKIENPKSPDGLGRPSSDTDEFWQRFLAIVHPIDQPLPDAWRQYYETLFELARELAPRRVCEIGVRAGYSAFAILSANPTAWMLGVDADLDETAHNTHCGLKGLYQHAEKILAPFDYHLLLADSHTLGRLPRCDLVYIDGEHTLEGCLADLRLAARSTDQVLADDFDSIPAIRAACDQFAAERLDFTTRYIPNGLTGFLLFQRRSQEAARDE